MLFDTPHIEALGESAFLVRVGDDVSPRTNAAAVTLAGALRAALPLRIEVVPAFAAVGVFFNTTTDARSAVGSVIARVGGEPRAKAPRDEKEARTFKISVQYDGPDIDAVAGTLGISRKRLVKLHTDAVYTVMMLGFAPGFAYLGPLSPKLVLPRRAEPRSRVPPGSVAIAGGQTAIYPLATPGGWHLIGRTRHVLFDPGRTPAALLHPGDRVVFTKA